MTANTKKPITRKSRQSPARRRARNLAKQALVPHKGNDYRPHMVRRYGLLVVLVFVLAMNATYNFARTGNVLGVSTSMNSQQLLRLTNVERTNADLPALVSSDKLTKAAEMKLQDMFEAQYWSHIAPDGTKPWLWVKKAGYEYSIAGENLAKNYESADSTIAAWMASPEHRKNILDKQFVEVGFAIGTDVYENKTTTMTVAMYGRPASLAPIGSTSDSGLVDATMAPIYQLGTTLKELSPATITSLVLLLVALIVALAAHAYNDKLPPKLRRTWYARHGAIKASGIVGIMVLIIWLYAGNWV